MAHSTDRTLKNWLAPAAGFLAAAAFILWMRPQPPRVSTLADVLFLYGLAVMEVSAAALLSASVALGVAFAVRAPLRVTWSIASRAAWLVPLYLFLVVKSEWALAVGALLVLGIVHVLRNLQPARVQKPTLSSGRQVFSCVVAGAGLELCLVASGAGRTLTAVALVALGTLLIAWRATKPGPGGHPARGLITMFVAMVFSAGALVWQVGVRDGDGFLGFPVDPAIAASLFTLQKTFGGGRAGPLVPNRPETAKRADSADVKVKGAPHMGIYLWPDVKKEAILVPPLPSLGRRVFGKDQRTPLVIPFYGAYWFFRPPYTKPPFGSLVLHGSPAVQQFVSNDNSPLWEEAHQDLLTTFDLSCCRQVEVDVSNADQHAEFVEMELSLVDTSKRGRQILPLGMKTLMTRPGKVALPETVVYPIPAKSKVTKMTELVVRFRLVAPRWSESAQIAIERFRLVPRR